MSRKFEVDKIHLKIYEVRPFEYTKSVGFTILWSSDIGFGEYTIYRMKDSQKWVADSEHMDINEDKAFVKELMRLFIEKLEIKE